MFVELYAFAGNLEISVRNPNVSINKTDEVVR